MTSRTRSRRLLRVLPFFVVAYGAILCDGSAQVAHGQLMELSPQLQGTLRYIHVGMVGGRVSATAAFSGRSFTSNTQSEERQENLRVDMTGQAPGVDYQLTTKSFKVSVELVNGNQLKIVRSPLNGGTMKPLEFNQPPEGRITVKVGDGDAAKTYEADSLWHLMTAEPDLAKNDLEPLLRLLRPGWSLSSITKSIEESLFKQAGATMNFDRRAWAALVAQLGSKKYVDREDADRRLRELGQTVVPFLRNLNSAQLDPEQAYRIRVIVRRYQSDEKDDSPETAAGWLAADPEIWYALAVRSPASRREAIRDQLERILGEPTKLDADAEGEKLKAQLDTIRGQIDRLKRATSSTK